MTRSENDLNNASYIPQLFIRKFSPREPKCLNGVAVGEDRDGQGSSHLGARSKFGGGCQGRRTGVAVTTVSNLLILGGWVTKVLRMVKKVRGEGGRRG